jgi:7-cyano-7-deazaguanine synthase
MKAVVLLSGGLDSTTTLYQAIADGADCILAVSFDYGSKHAAKELTAAEYVVEYVDMNFGDVGIRQRVVVMPNIFGGGKSAVMGDIDMPMEEYRNYEGGEGESVTVVPFRNANLIAAATTIAEVGGYDRVYVGMHATDHGTWAYPDCTPEFLGATANAVYVGTLHRVRLVFPLIWMTKAEVVTRAHLLDVPIDLTWSCYEGGEVHCGTCPTCLERIKAFQEAGIRDEVEYAVTTPFENWAAS